MQGARGKAGQPEFQPTSQNEKTESHNVSSDLHICTVVCTHAHVHANIHTLKE